MQHSEVCVRHSEADCILLGMLTNPVCTRQREREKAATAGRIYSQKHRKRSRYFIVKMPLFFS